MSTGALNKSKGNMYPWVNFTWNPIRGDCSHACSYCFVKDMPGYKPSPLRLDEKALKVDLGRGNTIFVGSSTDMWAKDVPPAWVDSVLARVACFMENQYLFQTKNPVMFSHLHWTARNVIFAVTIETNRDEVRYSSALPVDYRAFDMANVLQPRKMVSIEPVMDFDLAPFAEMIHDIEPEFVSIGADSKGHNLPEPPAVKVRELILELETFTKVIQKDNLKRILR